MINQQIRSISIDAYQKAFDFVKHVSFLNDSTAKARMQNQTNQFKIEHDVCQGDQYLPNLSRPLKYMFKEVEQELNVDVMKTIYLRVINDIVLIPDQLDRAN